MTLIDLPVTAAEPQPDMALHDDRMDVHHHPVEDPDSIVPLPPVHHVAARLVIGDLIVAGRLRIAPARADGGDHPVWHPAWMFEAARAPLSGPVLSRLADPATAIGLVPRVDGSAIWRRRLDPLRMVLVDIDGEAGLIRLATSDCQPLIDRLPRLATALPAMIDGRSLNRRAFPAHITAIGPYETVADVEGPPALLVPGTLLTLTVTRPWATPFRMTARLVAAGPVPADGIAAATTRIVLRMADRQAVDRAAILATCTAPGFGIHGLWTYGLRPRGLMRHLRVVPVASRADLVAAWSLRRDANRFFGRRPEAREPADWADHLDASSIVFLAILGDKPIATARLVLNDGDRSRSELQAQVPVPDQFWEGGFVEISRLVVHPDFRGNRIRYDLFREVERLSLSLGARYMLFDAIPKLAPLYEAVGGRRLPLTKKHPDSDETVQVMYVDMRRILGRLNRFSAVWLAGFGSTLGRHLAIEGRGPTDAILGPRRRTVAAAVIRGMGRLLARLAG
ncbi:hypothetical protein GCM10011505_35970 [Tistrella bauzanensis]|uniref:N-acetyltransferase domain-containing protein n=1 Tax=Tistrella bauzanensis TaxID=657419 RepID=A0ABQ1IWZ2_9PROT|nr:GNAT family N-acetyltransferase [Tistrella bauzanensis]GGB51676.1 hypothetical protein GCM10011505_35970 [Tistrella bauzanensis]